MASLITQYSDIETFLKSHDIDWTKHKIRDGQLCFSLENNDTVTIAWYNYGSGLGSYCDIEYRTKGDLHCETGPAKIRYKHTSKGTETVNYFFIKGRRIKRDDILSIKTNHKLLALDDVSLKL